jgi:hypothetical protein
MIDTSIKQPPTVQGVVQMAKHSITLGDGLFTLTAECELSEIVIKLNNSRVNKFTVSRALTHTLDEVGEGVFQNSVFLTDRLHREFRTEQTLPTSPRDYLEQVMHTVNKAREFYGLQPIKWKHVEDTRKVYLGGLLLTSTKDGFIYADEQLISHMLRPSGVLWSSIIESCNNPYGTTDSIVEVLTCINKLRAEAGMQKLVWEIV